MFCTSTDGHLILYKLENEQQFRKDKKPEKIIESVHRSGVNSFDIWNRESDILIASCGDDSSLCVVSLNFTQEEITHEKLIKQTMAHASSVMGIFLIISFFLEFKALFL